MAENPFVTRWAGTHDTTNLEYLTCIVFSHLNDDIKLWSFWFPEETEILYKCFTALKNISVFIVQENIIVPFSK